MAFNTSIEKYGVSDIWYGGVCRDPREQEQPGLPRRAALLPLPLLAARIRRGPAEVHHHAEQDQVTATLQHPCYWLSGQLLNMGLILKPDFPHHSPQTSDIHRHALASNMEAGGWCGNIYHNIPFKYRHSPLLRLNILSQFSCPPVKLYSGAVCVWACILCEADRADDKIKCFFRTSPQFCSFFSILPQVMDNNFMIGNTSQ